MGSLRSKRKWLSKIALLTVAALAATSLCGLLAGCGKNSDDEDETEAKSNPDTQLLKNGNFEFYEDNDGDYIYYTPDNWSRTSTGTTSYTASGIINTAPDQWDRMTSLQTAVKLYVNDLLSTYNSDDDLSSRYSDTYDDYHVEYAGLKDYDLLYRDPATVIDVLDNLEDFADDDENTLSVRRFERLLGENGDSYLRDVVDEYLFGVSGSYKTDEEKEEEDFLSSDDDEIFIANPYTHDKVIKKDEDGNYTYAATEYRADNGENNDVYRKTDEDDDDYDTKLYADKDCTDALESSVLMIHNYLKNGNGTSQYYGATTTITLEANTAAKISVWVKTSDLYYHGYTPVKQDRGAYISVTQSVGSTSLDSFTINSINTEKINPRPESSDEEWENNGWVKYTVYVQACDYAETTVSVNLGLGGTAAGEVCEGYAFFDDVEVTKYKSMNALEESEKAYFESEEYDGPEWDEMADNEEGWSIYDIITYENEGDEKRFVTKAENDRGNYVTLLNEGDEKVFYADEYYAWTDGEGDSYVENTDDGEEVRHYYTDPRYSDIFFYYIDLTSSSEKEYVTLNENTLTMGITVETVDGKDYTYPGIGSEEGKTSDLNIAYGLGDYTPAEYGQLLTDLFENENLSKIDITGDLLANILIGEFYDDEEDMEEGKTAAEKLKAYLIETYGSDDDGFGEYLYLDLLTEELYTAAYLPNYSTAYSDTIVMLSATGASYTADVESEYFTLEKDGYMIVSLWVKTSDTKSNTAATLTIMDTEDEDSNTSLTFQTTDVVTDIDDDEDIYDGWVQCFFYIHNDTDDEKTFKIRLQYGNTTISGNDLSAYTYGWAAFTNMQVLEVTETEYGYTQTGTYAASFTFSDSDNRENSYFDDATKDTDIEGNITTSSSYDGFNGGSSSVVEKETMTNIDVKNSNAYAGLINVDYFEDYLKKMLMLGGDKDLLEALTEMDEDTLIDENYAWLKQLILSDSAYKNTSITEALTSAEDLWRELFGVAAVQPLLIVNCLRTYTSSKEAELTEAQYTSGDYYVYISADDENFNKNASGDYYLKITEENYEQFSDGYSFYTLEQALNYGFMGDTVTLSEDTYTAITVRVKVVGDAEAYIYLTETSKDRDVMSFEVPDYTFWYDDDGNVLLTEPDEDDDKYDRLANIAYELRDDGLYEIYADKDKYDFDADGYVLSEDAWDYLYSNLNIYEIQYYDESAEYWYYNEDGDGLVAVSWDELDTDIKYFADENGETYAPHYLVSTTGTRVFTYAGEGIDDENGMNAVYYYYYYDEDDDTYTVSYENKVKSFDTNYAEPRYEASDFEEAVYMYKITSADCTDEDGNVDYVTVSFFIHTGNEEKSYKLELWSGERDSSGVGDLQTETMEDSAGNEITIVYPVTNMEIPEDGTDSENGDKYGYIVFDYSYIELDETTFADLMGEYVDGITRSYKQAILDYDAENGTSLFSEIESYDENIAYYERFFAEHEELKDVDLSEITDLYTALYYTFTLYDSAAYVPFNNETAQEDETGYAFTMSDYDETLAYFSYKDTKSRLYTTFIDYATVDQEIEVNRLSASEDEEEEESNTNAWILAASIVLVVALLATLISMFVRQILRNHKRRTSGKNSRNNRYRGGERPVRGTALPAEAGAEGGADM